MMVATLIGLVVLPLLTLRGRTLAAYYASGISLWSLALLLWRRVPSVDPYLGFVATAVLTVTILALLVARGAEVRWSAGRAAMTAAIVYALVVPAMLRTVIDGDEPFYLLLTESILHDSDLDLANQYRSLAESEAGRMDLEPQFGDPVGENGELYSRHEPFLALLMLPGYVVGGLHGAIAVIALFGVLLVRSTIRWMEDEGLPDGTIRAVFPLFALAPPVLFYATRIWPEVPAAFFFVEVLRGARERRSLRWVPALLGLVLLKLRFVLVAVSVIAMLFMSAREARRRRWQMLLVAAAIVALPLLIVWMVSGSALNVHSWRELLPATPAKYAIGFFGLIADGMSGIAFQAPFYLFGLFAVTRWKNTPSSFRFGIASSLLYLVYLIPRSEWYGGWAPPLRYLVFLTPLLALGAAVVWEQIPRGVILLVSAWSVALVVHGVAHPWRLFHIANGENAIGEWWSRLYGADFSRLFPSFIRVNDAAWIAAGVVAAAVLASLVAALAGKGRAKSSEQRATSRAPLSIAIFSLLLAAAFTYGRQPASHVELEDAHVTHEGGELHPELYALMRWSYRGGWIVREGDSLSFLARAGQWRLEAVTGLGATIEIAGRVHEIAPREGYQTIPVTIPRSGRVTVRCLRGALNLDRMTHE